MKLILDELCHNLLSCTECTGGLNIYWLLNLCLKDWMCTDKQLECDLAIIDQNTRTFSTASQCSVHHTNADACG